jgi:hypothetical protein
MNPSLRLRVIIRSLRMQRRFAETLLIVAASLAAFAIAAAEPKSLETITPPPTNVRNSLQLDDFYQKFLNARGLPIIGSYKVSDAALREAAWIVNHMLASREDVRKALIRHKVRVVVMAATELTTDVPEHRNLAPKNYWDKRARGLGATTDRPAVSCAEENLLNYPVDRYSTENILVHEFAHTIADLGLSSIDKSFEGALRAAYQSSLQSGLWKNTYAATNFQEYWAEGVQSYFDTNRAGDEQHNDVDTREELAHYDPLLFKLIDDAFQRADWRYQRYDKRHPRAIECNACPDQ